MSFLDSLFSVAQRFGKPVGRVPTVNVRFLGWTSEAARLNAGDPDGSGAGSLSYYMGEVAAGRRGPGFPPGLIIVDDVTSEVEGVGILPGTEIRITYDPKQISINAVLDYLRTLGIEAEEISQNKGTPTNKVTPA